ncbi:MAG: peroxiredoxin [bacterium]|nr:peroxiredoxin [bacterium]
MEVNVGALAFPTTKNTLPQSACSVVTARTRALVIGMINEPKKISPTQCRVAIGAARVAHLADSPRAIALLAATSFALVSLGAQSPVGFEPRSIDGSGNNLLHPEWGQALTELLRRAPHDYADGVGAPAGAHRPSARAVSNAIAAQVESVPNVRGATDYLWQWGQFLDHDLSLTEVAHPLEAMPIAVPTGDPWFDPFATGNATIDLERSHYAFDARGIRQQTNDITAFIDASQVYGSTAERAAELRGAGGRLRTSAGGLLPFNTNGFPNAPAASLTTFFLAGDVRANEQLGLTALHTLFVREHNAIVAALAPLGLTADANYEIARLLVGAEMQAITYNEFLPVLLGRGALRSYRGYRSDVDPRIANEFSTVAFRVGHTMLSSTLLRLGADGQPISDGNLALRDMFFAPHEIVQHGIEPTLRGLAGQLAQEIDPLIIDDVRNFLFGPPGAGGFDLAALNVQRGRDHGIPSYRRLRVAYGLPSVRDWRDVTRDQQRRAALASVYDSVADIDAWVGGLSEDHVDGAMVGPLFHRVLVDQFERLRDGDRFWYQQQLPSTVVDWIEQQTLATIIRRNTSIGSELPDNVFVAKLREPRGRGAGRESRRRGR